MNILIISGEVSGDLYASRLAETMKMTHQGLTVYAIGGQQLQAISDYFLFQSAYNHGVGVGSKLLKRSFKKQLLNHIDTLLKSTVIHKAIIVDFQHFNAPIAVKISSYDVPIYTFVTPNFWMWKAKKPAKTICDYSTKIMTIFKPEHDFYAQLCDHTYYFGHPLTQAIKSPETADVTFTPTPSITLLPGSRPQEFKLYLQEMLKTCKLLKQSHPQLQITLVLSSTHFMDTVKTYCKPFSDLNITISTQVAQDVIRTSSLVLAASGSATLEVILLKRPLIVFAALPSFTYFLAKYILRIRLPYISLPNFLANTMIVPEFVQNRIQSSKIASQAASILANPADYIKHYDQLIAELSGEQSIYASIAKEILIPS